MDLDGKPSVGDIPFVFSRGSLFSFFPVAGGTEKRVGKVTKNPEITERGQQRKASALCVLFAFLSFISQEGDLNNDSGGARYDSL
jgi:hypothetical protein